MKPVMPVMMDIHDTIREGGRTQKYDDHDSESNFLSYEQLRTIYASVRSVHMAKRKRKRQWLDIGYC
jgi:hypothetical protein